MSRLETTFECLCMSILGGMECSGLMPLVWEILSFNYTVPRVKFRVEQSAPMVENSGFYLSTDASIKQNITADMLRTNKDPILQQHAKNLFYNNNNMSPMFMLLTGIKARNPFLTDIYTDMRKDGSLLSEIFEDRQFEDESQLECGILMVDIGGSFEGSTPARIEMWAESEDNCDVDGVMKPVLDPTLGCRMKFGKELPDVGVTVSKCLRYVCLDSRNVAIPISVHLSLTLLDIFSCRHRLQVHSIALPFFLS